jgi:hypothetical protein
MNHLRASALTVEEFDRKENARTGQEITMPEQWRLYNRYISALKAINQ